MCEMQRRRCLPALTQENAEGLAKQMSNSVGSNGG